MTFIAARGGTLLLWNKGQGLGLPRKICCFYEIFSKLKKFSNKFLCFMVEVISTVTNYLEVFHDLHMWLSQYKKQFKLFRNFTR